MSFTWGHSGVALFQPRIIQCDNLNTAKILLCLGKVKRISVKVIFLLLSEGKRNSPSRNMNRLPGLWKLRGLLLLSRHLSFKGSDTTESEMWLNAFEES